MRRRERDRAGIRVETIQAPVPGNRCARLLLSVAVALRAASPEPPFRTELGTGCAAALSPRALLAGRAMREAEELPLRPRREPTRRLTDEPALRLGPRRDRDEPRRQLAV